MAEDQASEIKEFREGIGWTQNELAIKLSVGVETVNRWENEHQRPTKRVWADFARLRSMEFNNLAKVADEPGNEFDELQLRFSAISDALRILSALSSQPEVSLEPSEIDDRLSDVSRRALEFHEQMDAVIQRLQPPAVKQQKVTSTLEDLARQWQQRTKVPVVIDLQDGLQLANHAESVLYEVAQEALINVEQHSHAANTTVRLEANDREIQFTIADDGNGFDPRIEETAAGSGIRGMREQM